MIGSITTGSSFKNLFDYLLKPTKDANILGGNFNGETSEEISRNFNAVANLRPSTKKPVKHFVIAFAPEDGAISPDVKYRIAMETVQQMGYEDNQWIVIEHGRNDPDHFQEHNHDHIHIAVNMINCYAERVSDSFDKWRMQNVLRSLEEKYHFRQLKNSLFRNRRRPKQGQYRKFEKAFFGYIDEVKDFLQKSTNHMPQLPPEPEIQRLETIILAATDDQPTLSVYLARMQQFGIRVEEYEGKVSKRTKQPRKRFRYHLPNLAKSVTKVNGGTRVQVLKNVSYDPQCDDPNILKAKEGIAIDIPDSLKLSQSDLARQRYSWLSASKQKLLRDAQKLVEYSLNLRDKRQDLER